MTLTMFATQGLPENWNFSSHDASHFVDGALILKIDREGNDGNINIDIESRGLN
jgi:hypothetical protein